jgi:hypothetical protein
MKRRRQKSGTRKKVHATVESIGDFRERIARLMRNRETGKKYSVIGAARAHKSVVRSNGDGLVKIIDAKSEQPLWTFADNVASMEVWKSHDAINVIARKGRTQVAFRLPLKSARALCHFVWPSAQEE